MPPMPSPTEDSQSAHPRLPVTRPISRFTPNPNDSISITSIPAKARTSTSKYGTSFRGSAASGVTSTLTPRPLTTYMAKTSSTAGATMRILALNLSLMAQSNAFVAAIVVSLMKERLSPKKAPPTMMAAMNASENPASCAMPVAMGTSATIVPTLVPTDIEMKQAVKKSPAKSIEPGITRRVRFTVASMAPTSFAVCANAPARMKIQTIRRIRGLPAPSEKRSRRFLNVPLEIRTA